MDKADVCQIAVGSYNALLNAANAAGDEKPDLCAILNAHLFQSYSDHLQDLSDAVIGSLTEKMTAKLQEASVDYQAQKDA